MIALFDLFVYLPFISFFAPAGNQSLSGRYPENKRKAKAFWVKHQVPRKKETRDETWYHVIRSMWTATYWWWKWCTCKPSTKWKLRHSLLLENSKQQLIKGDLKWNALQLRIIFPRGKKRKAKIVGINPSCSRFALAQVFVRKIGDCLHSSALLR